MADRVHYAFDDAVFFPEECRLRVAGNDVILEQKVAGLLHAFCRRPGQVLTKNWLMEEIWPGRIVNEDSLSVAVSKLRRALGDRAGSPRFIRTVTGTGYLWLPGVRRISLAPAGAARPARSGRSRIAILSVVGLAGLVLAAGAVWWLLDGRAGVSEPESISTAQRELGELVERAASRLDSGRPEELRQAITEFRSILEHRPGSARAYLGIAEAKLELSALGGRLDLELYAEEAHALLDRAIALDPDNARAWLRKAELHFLADWDIDAAERAYLRAIELEPENPENYLPYSELLLTLGEFERAEEVLQQLRRADPAWYRFLNMSYVYYMRGELERALAETRRLMNSEADSDAYRKMLHRLTLLLGDDESAFAELEFLMQAEGLGDERIAEFRGVFDREGLPAVFGRLLDESLELNVGHYLPPIAWGRYAIVAGRREEALHWLNRAVDERQPQVLLLDVDPHYLPLRHDPEFRALLARLPERAGEPRNSD